MTLTAKHIEHANVCARLENAGYDVKEMARECGVSRRTIWNWSKCKAFIAEKARALGELRLDLSDIPLTHRRDRERAARYRGP